MNSKQLIEQMNWRYACKKFDSSKKISAENFSALLEVLRLSCSSYGIQPWKFVVVESQSLREKLIEKSYGQMQVAEASHLIVLCTRTDIDANLMKAYVASTAKARGQEVSTLEKFETMLVNNVANKDELWKEVWAKNQVYIASGFAMAACAQLQIDSCPMEGFSPKGYDEVLGLTAKHLKASLVLPVGYRDSSDKYSSLAKVRFATEEVILKL